MRLRSLALLLSLLVLLVGACSDDGVPEPPDGTPTAQATSGETAAPSPSPTPGGDELEQDGDGETDDLAAGDPGGEPVGETGTDEVVSDDFPGGTGEVAMLTGARVAAQDGFDRFVLEFEGDARPSYRVRYAQPPFTQAGSGDEVPVDGEAFLEVNLEPASGVDLTDEEPRQTYDGPGRIAPQQGQVIREAVRTGDFEANMTWVIGLEQQAPFAVTFLADPLRMVIDVETAEG